MREEGSGEPVAAWAGIILGTLWFGDFLTLWIALRSRHEVSASSETGS
jgi:hypothetical protein